MAQNFLSDIKLGDNIYIRLGDATNGDLQLFHNGTNSIINDNGTGNLQFQIAGTPIFDVTSNGITMAGWPESDYELKGDIDGGVRFDAQAGEALSKGDVVYISGASGDNTVVSKAQANSASTMPAFGLVLKDAANGAACQIVTFGNLYGSGAAALDTSTCTVGDEIFVSAATAGEWTKTAPTGESNLVQKIGKILRVATSNGVIKVSGAGRANATPNLNTGRLFVGNASNQAVADGTMYVDIANSRVGIGTSSPLDEVHISKSVNGDTTLQIENANAGTGARANLHLQSDASRLDIYATSSTYNGVASWVDAGVINAGTPSSGGLILNSQAGGIKFQTGTNERMRITSDGKVGIGTGANVDEKLHVQGNIKFEQASGNIDVRYTSNGTNKYNMFYEASTDAWGVYYNPSSAYRLFLNSSGNFGIGTNSPSYKFVAYGDSSDSEIVASFGSANDQGEYTAIGLSGFIASNGATKAGIALKRTNTYGTGELHFLNNNTLDNSDMTLSDSKMMIDSSGNVGIGTTSPSALLEISDNNTIKTAIHIDNTSTGGNRWDIASIGSGVSGRVGNLQIRNDSDSLNIVEITHDGKVGIGTESPYTLLELSSTDPIIRMTDSNGVADKSIYEMRAIGASGYESLEFRSVNDANNDYNKLLVLRHGGNVGLGTDQPLRDLHLKKSNSGGQVRAEVFNTSNTANSHGIVSIYSGGASAGDPFLHWKVEGVQDWSMGIDNSDSDKLKISKNFGPGTNDYLSIDTSGNSTFAGSIIATDSSTSTIKILPTGGTTQFISRNSADDGYVSHISDATQHIYKVSNSEKMRLDSSGKLGLGVTSPSAPLSIQTSSTSQTIRLIGRSADGSSYIQFRNNADSSNYAEIGSDNNSVLLFNTNGSEAMRLDSSGNLGLGTTNATPSNGGGMCINGGGITRIDWRNSTTGDATGDGTSLQLNGNDFTIENRESGYVAISTSLTERMRIDSSGNVGINQTNPSSKLHITNASGGSGGYLKVTDAVYNGDVRFGMADGIDNDAHFGTWTNNNIVAFTNGSERARFDSSGRLGLGTSSPSSYDSNADDLVIASTGNTGITIAGGTTGASSIYFADGTSGGAEYTGFIDYLHSSDALRFGTNGGTERLRITSDGNVGIGTTSPDESLHIKNSDGANIILNSDANTNDSGIYMSEGADATPTQNGAYVYYDASENEFKIATGGSSLIDRLTIARDTGNATFAGNVTPKKGLDWLTTDGINSGTAAWRRIGTWAAGQNGRMLRLQIIAGSGYNANLGQQGYLTVILRTSNGSSTQTATNGAAVKFSGHFYQSGYTRLTENSIRVEVSATDEYTIYMNTKNFIGASPIIADASDGTTFTVHADTGGSASDFSSSNYLDLTEANKILSDIAFTGSITLSDSQAIKWGSENILSHNGTTTYLGDNTSASALSLTGGGNATFAGNITVQGATTRLENNVTVGNSSGDYLETRYNDTANYATRLMWRGLQFGNNGVAKIVAGRTAANGFFEFYVNNTNDGLANTPDGNLALTIAANKNATFAGRVKGTNFNSVENSTDGGFSSTRDYLLAGTGDRGGGLIINDISGARFAMYAGGYDLTFTKETDDGAGTLSQDIWMRANAADAASNVSSIDFLKESIFAGDVTVSGNLTVNGTQTILNTQTIEVEDNIIVLNKTNTSMTATTSGISVYRGASAAASFIFDDSDDYWDLTHNLAVAGNGTFGGTVTVSDDFTLDNSSPEMYFKTGASHYNWMIAAQENVSTALEFTPANAVGATGTHNTPALTLYANRAATFAGAITLAGTLTNNVAQANASPGNTVTLTKINSNNAYTEYTGFLGWTYSGTGSNPYTFNLVFDAGTLDVAYEVVLRTGRNGNWRNFGAMKDFGYIYNESDGDFKHNAEGDVTIASSLGAGRFSLDSDPVGFGATADNQTSDPGTGGGLYTKFIRRYSFNFENNTTGSNGEWEIYVKVYNFASNIKFLKA